MKESMEDRGYILLPQLMYRDKEVSKLKKQIHSLKEQLYTCEADLEKASSVTEGLK